jgi:hypothetical protein
MKYTWEINYSLDRPVHVRSDHGYEATMNILRMPWSFRLDRRDWGELVSMDVLQMQLPVDCGVEFELPSPAPLTPVKLSFAKPPRLTYAAAIYNVTPTPNTQPHRHYINHYDHFYFPRKPWKRLTVEHCTHLLAQGGWRVEWV